MIKEKSITLQPKIEEIDVLIGKNLRTLRLDRGLSQKEIAKHLGISFQQVQKYEKGTNRLSAGKLYKLSMILNISLYDFYAGLYPPYEHNSEGDLHPHKLDAETFILLEIFNKIKNTELKESLIKTLKNLTDRPS